MRATIQNRAFELPADNWYQIEVNGVHPNRAAGIVQVIDSEAVDSIVKNFNPGASGMLIDTDHFSHDIDKPTVSYGWLMEVQNRDGQLYGNIKWTNTGQPAVEGGDYRFFSSEYSASDLEVIENGRVRPKRLSGLTLTNRPNNKGGTPISNRGVEKKSQPTKPKPKKPMNEIAKLLGLAEDATEEEILEKMRALMSASTENSEQLAVANKEIEAIRNREVEELLTKHADKIGDQKDFWKDALIKNRESSEKALIAMPAKTVEKPKGETTTPIHNRETATPPETLKNADKAEKDAEQKKVIGAIKNRDKCSNTEAFNQARLERPELF